MQQQQLLMLLLLVWGKKKKEQQHTFALMAGPFGANPRAQQIQQDGHERNGQQQD